MIVKTKPLEPSQPTKFDFLEYVLKSIDKNYGLQENVSMDYLYEYYNDDLNNSFDLERLQSKKIPKSIVEEYFKGNDSETLMVIKGPLEPSPPSNLEFFRFLFRI